MNSVRIESHSVNCLGVFTIKNKVIGITKNHNLFLKIEIENNYGKKWGYIFKDVNMYEKLLNINDSVEVYGHYSFMGNEKIVNCHRIVKSDLDRNKKLNSIKYYIQDKNLRMILDSILDDTKNMERFIIWPASCSHHHSYKGGLFDHTFESIDLGINLAQTENYKSRINTDILIMGLFLHDIGKIFEIEIKENKYVFSEYGKKLGHIKLGQSYFYKRYLKYFKKIDSKIILDLMHIIETHHSTYSKSFSPNNIRPATPEAIIVNKIESLSAELNNF